MRGMKDFSARQMRREYGGVLKNCWVGAVVWLLAGAFAGAVAVSRHAEEKQLLLLTGVFLVPPVLCLGLYLIFSDIRRLRKKTPYGQALRALGDPEEVQAEIDMSAQAQCTDYGSFILLKDFLIMRYVNGWRLDPRRVCARPFRRADIQAAQILPGRNERDPEEKRIQLIVKDEPFEFVCYQLQDWEALRDWLKERERVNL